MPNAMPAMNLLLIGARCAVIPRPADDESPVVMQWAHPVPRNSRVSRGPTEVREFVGSVACYALYSPRQNNQGAAGMHWAVAINGGNPPDNEAASDLGSLVVLFSLNQELLYYRSERGILEGRDLVGSIANNICGSLRRNSRAALPRASPPPRF